MSVVVRDPRKSEHDLVVGIDLGTTHTLLSFVENDNTVLLNWDGSNKSPLLPSVASYSMSGNVKVGFEALDDPQDSGILASTKRLLEEPNQYIWNKVTPLLVAKDILNYVKTHTEKKLNRTITGCVISVPAYFDDIQRLATKTVASIAGLNVIRIINEPTAAALAYGFDKKKSGTYAVYDFGGGTFDISVLSIQDNYFRVLSTYGDTQLGGDDIDNAILKHWYGQGHTDIQFLKKHVKIAKESLSDFRTHDDKSKMTAPIQLTHDDLKKITAPILEQTFSYMRKAFKEAKSLPKDGIILVGGASKTYGLKQSLKQNFTLPVFDNVNPDTIVAEGAGMHAHNLIFKNKHVLLDVLPLSLGIETGGGLSEKIITKNSSLPCRKEQIFTTQENDQTGIKIHVLQGERELAKDCKTLANFTLKNIPLLPAGMPRIKVVFSVDVDGLITVSATETTTGQTLSQQIESCLDKKEIELQLLKANELAQKDMTERLSIEYRYKLKKIFELIEGYLNHPTNLLESEIEILKEVLSHKFTIETYSVKQLKEFFDSVSSQLIPISNRLINLGLTQNLKGTKI